MKALNRQIRTKADSSADYAGSSLTTESWKEVFEADKVAGVVYQFVCQAVLDAMRDKSKLITDEAVEQLHRDMAALAANEPTAGPSTNPQSSLQEKGKGKATDSLTVLGCAKLRSHEGTFRVHHHAYYRDQFRAQVTSTFPRMQTNL